MMLVGLLVFALAVVTLDAAPVAAQVGHDGDDVLEHGEYLAPDEAIWSEDGSVKLVNQGSDGHPVLHVDGQPEFATGVYGPTLVGGVLTVGADGELMQIVNGMYAWGNKVRQPGAVYRVTNTGEIVGYAPGIGEFWRAGRYRVSPGQEPTEPEPAPPPVEPTEAEPIPIPTGPVASSETVSIRGIWVHKSIADNLETLLAHADEHGISLSGWGHRDHETQIRLRREHCGTSNWAIYEMPSSQCSPPTARPGRSQHEYGLAIDFTYNGSSIGSHSNPGWVFLNNHAANYGFYNLASEPWHWSTNGR